MIIGKQEFLTLIREAVKRQDKKDELAKRISELESEIKNLDDNSILLKELIGTGEDTAMYAPAGSPMHQATEETEKESIYASKPGQTVILNFQDRTIKVVRQVDDLFKVVDAEQSHALEDGDLVKITVKKGEHVWQKGKEYDFKFMNRLLGKIYHSNPLLSWEFIRN